jgi:transglutaminase-like putative cysteine protease
MTSKKSPYLRPTATIDCDHPAVLAFARDNVGDRVTERERAAALFYAVRDGVRYDPYTVELTVAGLRASTTLKTRRAWCVPKSVLLAACCRAVGIPARLGFADVRNHLSTARMRKYMDADVFFWHGYTSMRLDGVWVKATPAFNAELCERFRLKPLDFDGSSDALFHPFDIDGRQHMEYVNDRGEYADVPIGRIAETFRREYASFARLRKEDFDMDVDQELKRE